MLSTASSFSLYSDDHSLNARCSVCGDTAHFPDDCSNVCAFCLIKRGKIMNVADCVNDAEKHDAPSDYCPECWTEGSAIRCNKQALCDYHAKQPRNVKYHNTADHVGHDDHDNVNPWTIVLSGRVYQLTHVRVISATPAPPTNRSTSQPTTQPASQPVMTCSVPGCKQNHLLRDHTCSICRSKGHSAHNCKQRCVHCKKANVFNHKDACNRHAVRPNSPQHVRTGTHYPLKLY